MKNKNKFIIGIFSIIIGITIAIQLKANVEAYVPATIQSIQDTLKEIDIVKSEINELNKIIEEREEELKTLEQIAEGDENIIEVLNSEKQKS